MGRSKEVWIEQQHHEAGMSSKRSCSPAALIPPVKSWQFMPSSSADGVVKSVPIAHQQRPIVLSIQNAFSPFEPSAFHEGSSRKTLTLRLSKEWDAAFDCLEACLLHEVATSTYEFFGRPLGEEEVREMYKPITKKKVIMLAFCAPSSTPMVHTRHATGPWTRRAWMRRRPSPTFT